ncbi:MAG: MerR family transcriptional regulator [Myxococcota bacterium]
MSIGTIDGRTTYPLRTAAKLTGLSPEVLRAWERRHRVVEPARSAGGTRRYSADDLERLRLVKAAVDNGHRIGRVAHLSSEELRRCARSSTSGQQDSAIASTLAALARFDAAETHRQLSTRLSTLGPARFAREVASPLAREVGERWAAGRLGVASEHLVTSTLRSLMGASLQPSAASLHGPRIVFATPVGEGHELGLLMAALTALGAGANPLYLGPGVPVDDLLEAVTGVEAAALALSLITLERTESEGVLRALRAGLPEGVALWIGGRGAASVAGEGVAFLDDLDALEHRVALLRAR